jgi:5S rRNA maturation endonuclease (ribonuclease M5)
MKLNPSLKASLQKYFDYHIIVEGKKDISSLKALGFTNLHAIHETGVPIKVRIEQIAQLLEKRDKVCILTDFDKKGKELYLLIKSLCQEQGIKLDSSLRGLLLKTQISHIEGLHKFFKKLEEIN